MRRRILLVACTLTSLFVSAQIETHYIYPSDAPTDKDTLTSVLKIVVRQGSRKLSGILSFSEDTIYYNGCYFIGNAHSDRYIYDTLIINPMSAGVYYYILTLNHTPDVADTSCELPPPVLQTRIHDTVITVSKYTGIEYVSGSQLQAAMLNSEMLQLHAPHTGTTTIQVLDAAGRQYYVVQKQVAKGKNDITLDMPELPSGMYIYHVQLGEQRKVLKYVKQ